MSARVLSSLSEAWILGLAVYGLEFGVEGFGFRGLVVAFRVQGFRGFLGFWGFVGFGPLTST